MNTNLPDFVAVSVIKQTGRGSKEYKIPVVPATTNSGKRRQFLWALFE